MMDKRTRFQNRFDSNTMIIGIITLVVLLIKHIWDFQLPSEIVDIVTELALGMYTAYAIGNNPSIKGEY